MKVRTLMAPDVVKADVGDSLLDAGERMRRDGISALAVLSRGRLTGIITERDLVTALVNGVDPRRTLVAAFMTPEPAVVSPDEQVSAAALRMVTLGVRHLPVVQSGCVVGMLSARDLLARNLHDAARSDG